MKILRLNQSLLRNKLRFKIHFAKNYKEEKKGRGLIFFRQNQSLLIYTRILDLANLYHVKKIPSKVSQYHARKVLNKANHYHALKLVILVNTLISKVGDILVN